MGRGGRGGYKTGGGGLASEISPLQIGEGVGQSFSHAERWTQNFLWYF